MPRQFNGKMKVFSINGVGTTDKTIEKNLTLFPTSHYTHKKFEVYYTPEHKFHNYKVCTRTKEKAEVS